MAKKTNKVIISCAMTGAIHTPTMSDYLPITPEDLVRQGVDAAEAGATILHLHARDPETGMPTGNPDVYQQFLPRLKAQCNAVLNITTGGGMHMSLEDRLKPAIMAQPEMCSLNMGSLSGGKKIHYLETRLGKALFGGDRRFYFSKYI